jgi:hypothetical protein
MFLFIADHEFENFIFLLMVDLKILFFVNHHQKNKILSIIINPKYYFHQPLSIPKILFLSIIINPKNNFVDYQFRNKILSIIINFKN